jgi:superfamily II DNA or RNA helicase
MPDFPDITPEQIVEWLGQDIAEKGEDYFDRGLVSELDAHESEAALDAAVQGRESRPYLVNIRYLSESTISSHCSCPMGTACKHVAAVLYAQLEALTEDEPAPVFAFGQWLGALDKVRDGKLPTQDYPSSVKQRLLYILEPEGDQDVRLSFLSARILKSGGYGRATSYDASNVLNYSAPKYVLSVDERILREVATDCSFGSMRSYKLKGEQGLSILKWALTTGRCHWRSKDNPALKRADKRFGCWQWKLTAKGDQHLTLHMDKDEIIVPTSPPWFIDPQQGMSGAVDSGQKADMAEILLNMPAVELDCADELMTSVAEQLPEGIPAPVRLKHVYRQVAPVPILQLETMKLPHRWGYRVPKQCHSVKLIFDYDGQRAPYVAAAPDIRIIKGDRVIDYKRDVQAEKQAVEALGGADLIALRDNRLAHFYDFSEHSFSLDDETYWPEWVLHEIPHLKEQGFCVEVDESFAFKVEKARAWNLNLGGDGKSLLGETKFMVTLDQGEGDGEEIDLIDALARWVGEHPELLKQEALSELKGQQSIPLPLPDGRLLAAPGEVIASILYYMIDVFASGKSNEALLSAPQMLALEASLIDLNTPIQISTNVWLQQMKQLADIEHVEPCEVPAGLKAELRGYQRDGLSWMQFLRQMQLGGILADDMGLGKTVQALAHILKEKEDGRLQQPALIIAPTSLMHNWRREAEKFTPDLSVLTVHGAERSRHFDQLAEYDVVLTTYPLLVRDFEVLEAQPWYLLILDEAQYIKNPRSKMAQQVRRLQAVHKLCMTGTPMENHLGELWAQFDFLMPGYLYDQRGFTRFFRKPIELEGDAARQEALNLRIRPFLLRRSKSDVALELPAKTEIIRSIEIDGRQRELYESVRLAMQKKVRDAMAVMGVGQTQIVVLDALMKMRQVCCDPRLVTGLDEKAPDSAKLEMLRDMLIEMIDEGRRILLFSQFTSMLKLIEDELNTLSIDYVKLTGQSKDRVTPVERFQNHEVPVFLISLKAGGVGLNLTAADTVIHYDPWWNPAAETQATDRAHRIGQDKAVFVYKLITEGTVEERILEMQDRKRLLAASIHQKSGSQAALWTPEDIDSLFAPLS